MEVKLRFIFVVFAVFVLWSCQNEEVGLQYQNTFGKYTGEVLIINEGNFNAGNAALTEYIPFTENTNDRVFANANGFGPGDVAQDAVWVGDECWIAINGSGKLWKVDRDLVVLEQWNNIGTPVRILDFGNHVVINDLFSSKVRFIHTENGTVEMIEIPSRVVDMAVYQNDLWLILSSGTCLKMNESFQQQVLPLNSNYRRVVAQSTGIILIDDSGNLYSQNETPLGNLPGVPDYSDGFGNQLIYIVEDKLYRYSSTSNENKLLSQLGFSPYGLSVNPENGDMYVFDPKEYNSRGECHRFNISGIPIDQFKCGIIPVRAVFRP
jgi:DNA-binding beta-propeller fold protein YncE